MEIRNNLLGNMGDDSVFLMERDDSPDGRPDTENEGHKPDVKSVKADMTVVGVDKWGKCARLYGSQ